MRGVSSHFTVVSIVVAMSAWLTGCAGSTPGDGAGSATPSATATASPSPSTSPAPSVSATPSAPASPVGEPDAASILIGAEATDILDESGDILVSLRYLDDGDAAVAAVTQVLGEPGSTLHDEGSPHYPASDGFMWGGFELWVDRFTPESGAEVGPYSPAFHTRAVAAEAIPGVSIAAVDGTVVGEPFEPLATGKSPELVHRDETFGIDSVALDLPESFPGIVDDGDTSRAYGVIGFTDETGVTITDITAPMHLYSLV
jgi:hypothetical protein